MGIFKRKQTRFVNLGVNTFKREMIDAVRENCYGNAIIHWHDSSGKAWIDVLEGMNADKAREILGWESVAAPEQEKK